ncbi:MAG: hypothetical protein ACPH7I_03225, partial [Flavobacteriaceae bacterium]
AEEVEEVLAEARALLPGLRAEEKAVGLARLHDEAEGVAMSRSLDAAGPSSSAEATSSTQHDCVI